MELHFRAGAGSIPSAVRYNAFLPEAQGTQYTRFPLRRIHKEDANAVFEKDTILTILSLMLVHIITWLTNNSRDTVWAESHQFMWDRVSAQLQAEYLAIGLYSVGAANQLLRHDNLRN